MPAARKCPKVAEADDAWAESKEVKEMKSQQSQLQEMNLGSEV